MKPIVRNIIAVVAGWILGSIVNGGLIQVGMSVYPVDVDPNDWDALAAFLENAPSKHFIFPYLAHALGTLVGAFVAAMISKNRKLSIALIVGGIFFVGGVLVNIILPAPSWFVVADLISYIPMAFIGYFLAKSLRRKK